MMFAVRLTLIFSSYLHLVSLLWAKLRFLPKKESCHLLCCTMKAFCSFLSEEFNNQCLHLDDYFHFEPSIHVSQSCCWEVYGNFTVTLFHTDFLQCT